MALALRLSFKQASLELKPAARLQILPTICISNSSLRLFHKSPHGFVQSIEGKTSVGFCYQLLSKYIKVGVSDMSESKTNFVKTESSERACMDQG